MRKNRVLIWLFALCVFFSCNNADIDPVLNGEKNNDLRIYEIVDQNGLEGGIDAEKSTLSEVDALTVAKLFNSGAIEARSGNPKSVKQIMSVSDDLGEPLMFIVNFEDNNGYVIISATKNMHAILAYSDEGNFDESCLNTGMSTYIDEFKYGIKEVINKDIDSLRIKYALSWSSFEQQNDDLSISTRSFGANSKVQAEIARLENLGYDCLPLSHLASYIGTSEANSLISNLCYHSNSSYDCASHAFVVVGPGEIASQTSLLKTAWHQGFPFNLGTSNGYAGCWPIAIAQVMKYHEWPTNYNWSNIPLNPSSNNDLNSLMRDIRNRCEADYLDDGTGVYLDNAVAALNRYFGYNATTYLYDPNISYYLRIRSSLDDRNPVFMRGIRLKADGTEVGHAWIAHGYRERHRFVGIAYIPMYQHNYSIHHVTNDGIYDKYLNMNWGWGQNSDYVYYSSAIPTGSSSDYSIDRRIVIVTK